MRRAAAGGAAALGALLALIAGLDQSRRPLRRLTR